MIESEHLRQHSRRKRAIQPGDITVELAVYTDAEFTASLGVTDTQSRVELMLVKYNGVQMEWSRADQLGYNVTFQIKYMNFLETNPAWLDTSSSLLGTWLSTFCAGKTTDPYDLFYMHVGTQSLDVTGRAYLSSACNQNTNCGVDNTLNPLEYVATSHEIGHNFGMLHDADAGCTGDDVGNMGNYGAGWSTCNADQIHNFLRDFNVECLWEENIPTSQVDPLLQGVTLVPELPGQFLSADQVCEAKYGDGFQFRMYPLLTVCTIHSCVNHTLGPKYGQMFREDYIPGLYCADGMICFKRACETWAVAKQENLEVREGGWGQWGEWSGCSRTCGRGVNFRRRACDSPIPKNHPTCEGNRFDAQTCNVQACDGDSTDETTLKTQRASETCALLVTNDVIDSEVYRSTGSVYSSTRHGQCEVLCDTVDGSDVPSFTRFGLMPQGTPCTAEDENQWDRDDWPRGPGYTSMCMDGYCEKFGCDGHFNGAQYDECGVCGGDDSTCDVISGFDNATQTQGERRILATLPVGAFNIQFWFTYSEMRQNYIEIYTKEDAIVLASYRSVNWIFITGDNPVSYADTEWHFNYNSQFLHAEGPITEPAVIKLPPVVVLVKMAECGTTICVLVNVQVVTWVFNNTRCADDCRGYCVLSCMVERYGIENGNVTADCLCDPGLTTDAETGLPTWCFRPQGECNFFSDCLQAKYSSCGDLPTSQLTSHCGWLTDNLYFDNCLSRALDQRNPPLLSSLFCAILGSRHFS
ncbi:hypothetical protein FSP39_016727 [Pinctada imbricata]|uniref:Peptidase M12B domain-containing protein n=1 Tax=Pinctada imbricata TaxID=66713 RepID=A0AA88Y0V2_PINIB|nr:hypothetical protein FSP39_016727 [Pinctada imbricata]